MPYLPTVFPALADARFPKGYDKDLKFQVARIAEQYKRMFPLYDYYQISKVTTEPADLVSLDTPTGAVGTTQFDPLYGEAIPHTMQGGTVEQPHGKTAFDATTTTVYKPRIQVNVRLSREAKDTDLKRWGFDKVRDMIGFVPLSLMDDANAIIQQGDYLVWGTEELEVQDINLEGWWKNTNVKLFGVMNLQHRRKGS